MRLHIETIHLQCHWNKTFPIPYNNEGEEAFSQLQSEDIHYEMYMRQSGKTEIFIIHFHSLHDPCFYSLFFCLSFSLQFSIFFHSRTTNKTMRAVWFIQAEKDQDVLYFHNEKILQHHFYGSPIDMKRDGTWQNFWMK